MQGMSFHMAFPGMAEPGVREVSVTVGSETTTFPVFEPLGFYLAVVPDRPPGSELRLTGRPGAEPFVYDVWRGS